MALTQMQLIQSLGEAMAWFERELNWGVPPTELRHLCGRIGELYAALVTNGQMAVEVNQKGYDVVSSAGERISVKTTATMGGGGHVAFNPNSLEFVDRVMILRINTEEMQVETLLDTPVSEALPMLTRESGGKRMLALSRLTTREAVPRSALKATIEVPHAGYLIRELENGTIEIERDGVVLVPVRPKLQELAMELNVPLVNGNGNAYNTRQLGSLVIKSVQEIAQRGASHPSRIDSAHPT